MHEISIGQMSAIVMTDEAAFPRILLRCVMWSEISSEVSRFMRQSIVCDLVILLILEVKMNPKSERTYLIPFWMKGKLNTNTTLKYECSDHYGDQLAWVRSRF
jgi:hypothetical protein